jgi:solute carrier family 50 protein (sugar transporter)
MSPSFGATFLQFAAPLACQALWAAPLPTVRKMKTKRSTEGLPPTGFFAMAANGYLWSMYGASAGMDLTIMLPNVTGLLAGCWYSWQFCKYDSGAFDIRVYGAMALASVVATTAIMLALAPSTARNVLGFLGCTVVVVMFVGPLQVIKSVLDTKSTKELPFAVSVATFVNCALWCAYGLFVTRDIFIWGPNALGLGSGVMQLGLFACFGPVAAAVQTTPQVAQAAAASAEQVDLEMAVAPRSLGSSKMRGMHVSESTDDLMSMGGTDLAANLADLGF